MGTITNFPFGVSSFGVPLASGGLLPFTGNYWWVNESNGSDADAGTSPSTAFATLTHALSKVIDNNNDVIFLTGTVHTTATVAWNKNQTHLIGLSAPNGITPRSRISQTGSTPFSPLVNVTGQGCIFMNIGTFHGFASATPQICWADNGARNYYQGCAFLGMGNATAAAQTGSRNLTVGAGGNGENLFVGCTIGLDTIQRTAANYSLEFLGATPRNQFKDCLFTADIGSGGAGAGFVNAATGSVDRTTIFKGCEFLNNIASGATTETQTMNVSSSAGGMIVLENCTIYGDTNLETSKSGVVILNGPVPTNTGTAKALVNNW